jgi:ribose-phosphate pyrophosphokinase
MQTTCVLYFEDEARAAQQLAHELGIEALEIHRHRFPDGELKLQLPVNLDGRVWIFRSLHQPNEKLVELLLTAQSLRSRGIHQLGLVCPYLAYMRQDIEFQPGEVVSQRVIGKFLAELFDAVVTVDPHLHRISTLDEAIAIEHPIALSGAPMLGAWVEQKRPGAFLLGPDGESAQWVAQAATPFGLDYAACTKVRHGDREVVIELPHVSLKGRQVVLLDDVASSGKTLAVACELALQAGAISVDVAVTHALFASNALALIKEAGVGEVWSTDCIEHPSNVIAMAPLLAQSIQSIENPKR